MTSVSVWFISCKPVPEESATNPAGSAVGHPASSYLVHRLVVSEPPPEKLVHVDRKRRVVVGVHVERIGQYKLAVFTEAQEHVAGG